MNDTVKEEHHVTSISEDHETTCWGCGLRLLLPSYTPIFKCGWCGAITNQNPLKHNNKYLRWRHIRDRCFIAILLIFMLFVICGGVWAVYPVIFSESYFRGILHCTITMLLSISTISSFSLAASRPPGPPPSIPWGSYPVVEKGGLENYSFCSYCSKPKSPRTHHCRSCGTCVLDMDHHCPFIGNCVGAANHQPFICFLFAAVLSTMYISIMSISVGCQLWPPLDHETIRHITTGSSHSPFIIMREIMFAFLSSAVLLSARGLVLAYLLVASISVGIGLTILLWQQLSYIYQGKTYLSHLSSRADEPVGERGCQNIFRFFGYQYSFSRYLPRFSRTKKIHKK
ncbi:hypothetical protein C5167_034673 [Papaver somniferum]|uniref:S-acyltransferase n=1 Tax=Papaver somniferum TaxID=3469 RepID=A0A4Y7KEU6_PAPSO|nr:protein S-acyltransferase 11-like [Papaver somniferum]RZC71377.1 hypothetical protein C5167_034673 [Papaver somniferum]